MEKIRLGREKKTVQAMIEIYCREMKHARRGRFCAACEELRQYALERLDRCVFGEEKPTCAKCPVHCYKPDRRKEIAVVMRYSGPKMIFHHPLLAIRHILDGKKEPGPKVLAVRERLAAVQAEKNPASAPGEAASSNPE